MPHTYDGTGVTRRPLLRLIQGLRTSERVAHQLAADVVGYSPLMGRRVEYRFKGRPSWLSRMWQRRRKPFVQFGPAAAPGNVLYRDGDGLLLPNKNNQPLAAGHASIEQVPLKHNVVLGEHRNDYRRIF